MRKKITLLTNVVGGVHMSVGTNSKDELISNLKTLFESFKTYRKKDKKDVETRIKQGLKEYGILPGEIQEVINDPERLDEIDIIKVYFLSEQTYEATKRSDINPESYFTAREIKEIKTTYEKYTPEKIEFPYTFHDVTRVNEGDYFLPIKHTELNTLFENGLLQYNKETQRESRQLTKGDQIIEVPKLHMKNIMEMYALGEKRELISWVFTFNARLGSSDEGEELVYDEYNRTLTVTKGTLLDVLDGFHRLNTISMLLRNNPNIDMPISKLVILNCDKKGAQKNFSQMNTTAPIAKSHLKKMSESRQSDFIAKYVQNNSELSGKMAASDRISHGSNLLITFNTLSDAIDDVYKVADKAEAIKVSKYITEFINTLFTEFPDEFLSNNIAKIRDESLINANSMFFGYILLSKLMKEKEIPLQKLKDIMDDIDFSRKNKIWIDKKLVDSEGNITSKNAKKIIYSVFEELDLEKYKEGDVND